MLFSIIYSVTLFESTLLIQYYSPIFLVYLERMTSRAEVSPKQEMMKAHVVVRNESDSFGTFVIIGKSYLVPLFAITAVNARMSRLRNRISAGGTSIQVFRSL